MIRLAENTYGKCRVRVVRVKRDHPIHQFQEWDVEVLLTGDFEECFTVGDNKNILATDTMKNTVYSLARDSAACCIEDLASEISRFLIAHNPQVETAKVSIASIPWEHVLADGVPHPTAFVRGGSELQTTNVTCGQDGKDSVSSGIENLTIMKTAKSGFEGFLRDRYTTLPETADRLLGTALRAQWSYQRGASTFEDFRRKTRNLLLSTFAEHDSKSVQHTLYAMGEAVLENIPEIEDIELVMPNKHCLLVDLSRFGQTNPNEIFVPTDEPYGYIEARLCRQS
jgi:urate oxidase